MATVKEILDAFDAIAPFYMKMDFDNIGLLAGFPDATVTRAMAALDITDGVIEEAASWGAQLIVSHHPLLFHPIKSVTSDDDRGRKIIRLIQTGMSAICLHTNMDAAEGGVNDALMDALGVRVTGLLDPDGFHPDGTPYGIARVGELPKAMELDAFLARTKERLRCNGLRYVPGGRPARKVACCGGSGGSELEKVIAAGCDTYVTADLKYDQFLLAAESGLNLIDADHFCTENVVVPRLKGWLDERFPEIEVRVSETHRQTALFY